ncbi:surface-adhesin E family protein [Polynucleobacter campilacus]|uniref:Surface-adhesin protein E-like domain-containing protein n=1 Tax=Polynucleobacter campilacus TaxID=1743163 RepID=A0A254PRZ9_9BURK|nr:surface-adhesin E family protein [Polynucleobacter campilacus]OWS69078.1 hypothetical protein CBI31_08360 [Polynucleobacter campilacus]
MKKLTHLITATIFTASMSGIGNAYAEWKELGFNEVMVVYVDLDTVRTSGEKTQVMSMLDLKKPGKNPSNKETVNSIVGLNEYSCPEISYRPIAFKEFSGSKGTGKVVSDNNTPDSKFEPIINESWTAGVFNVVCQRK